MKQPELGLKIAELRRQNGLSQEDLALDADVNVRSIQRIEAGEVEPRLGTLKILSDLLEFDFLNNKPDEASLWLLLMHLSSVFPIVVIPVIIWFMKRGEDPRIDKQAPDVINFQLSAVVYLFAASMLVFIAIGMVLLPLLGMAIFLISITNTIKVALDQEYNYPYTLKFIKM